MPAWALAAVQANTRAKVFTHPIEGTPTRGWELYPGKRYFRQYGAVNARGMWLVVQEPGDTMDLTPGRRS